MDFWYNIIQLLSIFINIFPFLYEFIFSFIRLSIAVTKIWFT